MTQKTYTIVKTRGRTGTESEFTGTVEELTDMFSYTLECGNSWNSKINRTPKTAKSLVNALNKCVSELQSGSYYPDDYELRS